jgi:hypothetical protein
MPRAGCSGTFGDTSPLTLAPVPLIGGPSVSGLSPLLSRVSNLAFAGVSAISVFSSRSPSASLPWPTLGVHHSAPRTRHLVPVALSALGTMNKANVADGDLLALRVCRVRPGAARGPHELHRIVWAAHRWNAS